MNTLILAAVDGSAVAEPVVATAHAIAALVPASVQTLHISEGDTLTQITTRCSDPDVFALVIGARAKPTMGVGHLVGPLVKGARKMVVVVPPAAGLSREWRTVLIAMKGTPHTARHLEAAIDWAANANVQLVVVHVDDVESIPSFSDQAAHATNAYVKEFQARFLQGVSNARLELRIGRPVDGILDVAKAVAADIVVIGWPDTAGTEFPAIATEILDRVDVPVLFVPEELAASLPLSSP